jgi:hypothetical protein
MLCSASVKLEIAPIYLLLVIVHSFCFFVIEIGHFASQNMVNFCKYTECFGSLHVIVWSSRVSVVSSSG